jgi:hypothetical protein
LKIFSIIIGIYLGRPIPIPARAADGIKKYKTALLISKISSGNNSYKNRPYTLITLVITNILKLSGICISLLGEKEKEMRGGFKVTPPFILGPQPQ